MSKALGKRALAASTAENLALGAGGGELFADADFKWKLATPVLQTEHSISFSLTMFRALFEVEMFA